MKVLQRDDTITYERIQQSISLGIFDSIHMAVALINVQMELCYCNESFIRIYDLPKNYVGKRIDNYLISDKNALVENLQQPKVVVCLSQPQSYKYCIFMSHPVHDESGEFRGAFIEIVPMISGRKALSGLLDSMKTIEMKIYAQGEKADRKSSRGNEPEKKSHFTFETLIGNSKQMQTLRYMGNKIAKSTQPVLITGESGTGKEMVAQAVHMASYRSDGPFVCVNCAALPAELMESEFFGYEAGAFTGARSSGMKGKFEEANNGTIFLDEIGELPLSLQAKLLRVLESGEIQKIGHKGFLRSNFRLVAATNRNLWDMIQHGQFREDLYHRLNVFELNIPPLRERGNDLFLLIRHFIDTALGPERGLQVNLGDDLVPVLRNYAWPGNVRELKNIITHALFLMDDDETMLGLHHLPPRFRNDMHATRSAYTISPVPAAPVQPSPPEQVDEKKLLEDALIRCQYNKVQVSKEMGISRSKLYRDLRKYGLLGATR